SQSKRCIGLMVGSHPPRRRKPPVSLLRTRPSTAHALPAPVIGIRLVDPLLPGVVGREVIGQEPLSSCVLIKKAWARLTTGSSDLISAWASAYSACPVAQASLAMPFAWLQPPSVFCLSLIRLTSGCNSPAGRSSRFHKTKRIAIDCGSSSVFDSTSHLTALSRA